MEMKETGDEVSFTTPVHKGLRDRFLLLLACAAGGTDALGILGLGGVFSSALSGNTVLLGIAAVQGRYEEAILCTMVFLGFVPGAVAGALLLRRVPKSSRWTGRTTAAMVIEAVILALFIGGLFLIGDAEDVLSLTPLVVLSSLAMGLQYAAIVRLNVHGVSTTFVTSTIVNLVWRLAVPEKAEKKAAPGERREGERRGLSDRTNLFLGAIWISYFSGALASAALSLHSRVAAALVPFLIIAGIVAHIGVATALSSRRDRNAKAR